MKLNRRKAMAAIVGGASTAPQIARSAMEKIGSVKYATSTMDTTPEPCYGEAKQVFDPYPDAQRLAQEKERLTKIANGDFSGVWQEREIEKRWVNHRHEARNNNINSLRSVTDTTKHRMLIKLYIEEDKKDWIDSAKKTLLTFFNKKPGDIF